MRTKFIIIILIIFSMSTIGVGDYNDIDRFDVGEPEQSAQISEIVDHLAYSTYLGDIATTAIDVDDNGHAYFSYRHPGGSTIRKMSANGSTVEYSWTMIDCIIQDIAVDSEWNVYATGSAGSSYTTLNAYDDTHNGGSDVFVFKLNSTGNGLNFSTYIGGSDAEQATSLDIDDSGNVFVAGYTGSSNFPTVNSYDDSLDGTTDAFFLKLNSTGNGLNFSSYLGGSGDETESVSRIHAIAVDSTGHIFISGVTESSDFPLLNPVIDTKLSEKVGYISKFNETGNGLEFSSYLMQSTATTDIVIDNADDVYVSGEALSYFEDQYDNLFSSQTHFPTSFVVKIANDGSSFPYTTALGTGEECYLDVDDAGNVYLAANMYDNYLPPLINPVIPDPGDFRNVMVMKLNSTGNGILSSTNLGGSEDTDLSYGIVIDQNSSMYVVGRTDSDNFPLRNPYISTFQHHGGFLSKIGDNTDNDNDALTNYEETVFGTDLNNEDTDFDLMPDGWEVLYNLNPLVNDAGSDADVDLLTNLDEYLNLCNATNPDTDSDALEDGPEVNDYHSDPLDPDSDDDTLLDGYEVSIGTSPTNEDSDSDEMPDGWEDTHGLNPLIDDAAGDPDNDDLLNVGEFNHQTDPFDSDSDDDTLLDGEEVLIYGTNPLAIDTDFDLLSDADEVNIHLTNPLSSDSDNDSLSDYAEINTHGTDPNDEDTDGDGANDADEIAAGTNPLVPDSTADSDHDGLPDIDEYELGTDPFDEDSDSDGLLDGWEVSRGLDPLETTQTTGEAIERVLIALGLGFGLFAGVFILTRKFKEKIDPQGIRITTKKPLLVPAIALFLVILIMVPFDVHGPIDSGINVKEFSNTRTFEVKDSQYLTNIINVYASYRMTVVETTTVTVTFTGPVERSVTLTIRSTSPVVQTESDSMNLNLLPGNYTVRISSSRTVNVKVTQTYVDARNNDQIQWLYYRVILIVAAIGILFIANRRKIGKKVNII